MAIRGGFEIATAYVELVLDNDKAKRQVRELPREMNPDAEKSGRDTGNALSRGIRLSIVRNSPLIASAVAGALAAGAPVALAGATAIFAGIGAIAAAQSTQVKSAWLGLWNEVKAGAQADAAVLVPTYVNMAARIGQSFESLRPQIRSAFAASAPQVDMLTTSILRAAESITGGLVRAVERGGPVIVGFGSFLESTGRGIADMFDAMSAHSPAAGTSLQVLGNIVGDLLPILGELLGQGVEIASIMLPALGAATHVVLGAVRLLGPALPLVTTALAGFRIAGVASGFLKTFSQQLAFTSLAAGDGRFAGAIGKASTVVGGLAKALPAVGIAIGVVGALMAAADQQTTEWSMALLKGGDAAAKAREQMSGIEQFLTSGTSGFFAQATGITNWATALGIGANATQEAEQKARDYLNSLTPLARAQHEQKVAQDLVSEAVGRYGEGSLRANEAQQRFEEASRAVAAQLAAEEAQLHGVTEAMIEMADQAAARANSDIAYRQSVVSTQKAIENLTKVQQDAKSTATDIADAQLQVEDSMLRQAEAAKALAFDALPATMDEQERNAQAARAALKELDALAATTGGLPANLETYRQSLVRAAGGMDTATLDAHSLVEGLRAVGQTAEQIPGTKQIKIEAPTEAIVAKLAELGFTITTIPGTKDILVSADTDQAKANVGDIAGLLIGLDGTQATPVVSLTDRATGPLDLIIAGLDGVRANPEINIRAILDDDQFLTDIAGYEAWILGLDNAEAHPDVSIDPSTDNVHTQTDSDLGDILGLDGASAHPSVTLDDLQPRGAFAWLFDTLNTLNGTTAVPTGLWNGDALTAGINGSTAQLQGLDAFVADPTATLDPAPFNGFFGDVMNKVTTLAAQRPTPVANMDGGPFTSIFNSAISMANQLAAQRPTPIASLNKDSFDGGVGAIVQMIAALSRMAIVLTATANTAAAEGALNWTARTRYSAVYQTVLTGKAGGGKIGDAVQGFAGGGSPGGKLHGPGGPRDDMIAAETTGGRPIRVSPLEWVIQALSSAKYGDRRMAAVNDGTALVLAPEEVAARAHGYLAGGQPTAAVTSSAGVASIHVGSLTVQIQGVFDLTKPAELRRLAMQLRELLLSIDREQS